MDELNQELLIVNQNGIELDYRIKCKRKVVDRIDYDTLLEEGQTTKRSVGHMSSGEYQVNEGRKMSVRREGEDLEQEMRTGIVEERRESRAIKLAGAL